ncbi:MAG: hypothetical protein R2799_10505 [Crocinitomicaceae bacterium]
MVKKLLAATTLFFTFFSTAQNIQLGLGAEGYINGVITNNNQSEVGFTNGYNTYLDQFGFDSLVPIIDTMFLTHNKFTAPFSFRVPIFVRYKMKNGMWFQLDYATENLTFKSSGDLNYSDEWISNSTLYYMSNYLWPHYDTTYNYNGIDSTQFMEDFYDVSFEKEKNYWKEGFAYKEMVSVNSLGFQFGYTFLRTKKIRPFLSIGFTWSSRKYKYSLQSLSSTNYYGNNEYTFVNELPEINQNLFFTNLTLGVEIHKIRFGLAGRININSLEDPYRNVERLSTNQILKTMYSFGGFMNFSLFDFNLRDAGDRKKLKDDEMKVLGDYVENKKKIKLSFGLDLPLYTNISNQYEQFGSYESELYWETNQGEQWGLAENVWIWHQKYVIEPDEANVSMEENEYNEILALGGIKMIKQFPGISFNMEYEPVSWFSWETKIGYQYNEYHTQGRFISQKVNWYFINDTSGGYWDYYSTETMSPIVLRETFHNLSLGQRFNFKFNVVPGFQIGFSGGAKANFFIPGTFVIEPNEYNDDPILPEFDSYWTRGTGNYGEKWKDIEDYSIGDTYDEYNFVYFDEVAYDQNGDLDLGSTFKNVGDDERMAHFKNKINFTWMAGIDFYFERLRFNLYTEGAITDINFLYRDYLSVGLGIYYYLRK